MIFRTQMHDMYVAVLTYKTCRQVIMQQFSGLGCAYAVIRLVRCMFPACITLLCILWFDSFRYTFCLPNVGSLSFLGHVMCFLVRVGLRTVSCFVVTRECNAALCYVHYIVKATYR